MKVGKAGPGSHQSMCPNSLSREKELPSIAAIFPNNTQEHSLIAGSKDKQIVLKHYYTARRSIIQQIPD